MLIQPSAFKLPKIHSTVILFYNLQYLYLFREFVDGGKVKPYGPSKRFNFKCGHKDVTALGGAIGAPLAAILIENAIQSGGEHFFAFGTVGAVSKGDLEIGTLITADRGLDETGMVADYGGTSPERQLTPFPNVDSIGHVVSVNSFFRKKTKKVDFYRRNHIQLIEMEATPISHIIQQKGGRFYPLFVVSDYVDDQYNWNSGFGSQMLLDGKQSAFRKIIATLSNEH